MADLATIASLGTAVGTMVLGVATFSSVRSSNRSARIAEQAFLVGVRPLLVPTRFEDPVEKVLFMDQHWLKVEGGRAVLEFTGEVAYFGMAVRNVGSGIAVLDRWQLFPERRTADDGPPDLATFRRLSRDLYIPPGDQGFWQGALREKDDPLRGPIEAAVRERQPMSLALLYADHEGGQRTITLFGIVPGDGDQWLSSVSKHWNVDRDDPR
jgi:hypothetical protein